MGAANYSGLGAVRPIRFVRGTAGCVISGRSPAHLPMAGTGRQQSLPNPRKCGGCRRRFGRSVIAQTAAKAAFHSDGECSDEGGLKGNLMSFNLKGSGYAFATG